MEMALLGERDPATREEVSGSSATILGIARARTTRPTLLKLDYAGKRIVK